MHPKKLSSSEFVAAAGGILLGLCVFLPRYSPNKGNPNAMVAGSREAVSAWDAHMLLRYLFLAAAVAPVILLYIVVRDHELSWPRGELTAVIGIAAFGLVVYQGIIDRPGEPPSEIELEFGWYIGVLGTLLIATGGALRASGTERPRKPPGVL